MRSGLVSHAAGGRSWVTVVACPEVTATAMLAWSGCAAWCQCVLGNHLRLLNAPLNDDADRLARQAALLGKWGSATLPSLRVAVVGAGGTGSHAALALAYLGVGDVLILDD